jgi:hypothetical protein
MSDERKIGQHTEARAGEYLFDTKSEGKQASKALDMRTRIKSEDGMRAILYLGTLAETMDSIVAGKLKDLTERLFISFNGEGRAEAVEILRQNFPKKVEIEKGSERMTITPDDRT